MLPIVYGILASGASVGRQQTQALMLFGLLSPHRCIDFAVCQQFAVGATLDNLTVCHDQNLISIDNRGQSMRDDQCGAALAELFQIGLNRSLGAGVERTGRFIKNQNTRIF